MKAKALVEVVVVFALTLLLIALVGVSPVGTWGRQVLHRQFIEYAVMIAVPLLILVATRRNLADYGLSLRNPSYHLSIAGIALIPVLIGSAPLAWVDEKQRTGALIMVGVEIAVLFAAAWMLRRHPTRNESGVVVGTVILIAFSSAAQQVSLGNAISAFIFYVLFLALGEELLFRGYIQSRLNEAWGRPFTFFGVNWGWGAVITSVLFGLMHVLNIGSLIMGNWQLTPWWGLWTFFGGFIGSFLREKTGSIAAPTIIHGLPQAIATAFLGV